MPLLEIFVKASSNKGDLILDPFGGSFSTAHACKILDRNSISIEVDEKYCKIGKERLQKTAPLKDFEEKPKKVKGYVLGHDPATIFKQAGFWKEN